MLVLALGKKGAGKTTLLRKLIFLRLGGPARPLVFWHDPQAQLNDAAGRVFNSVTEARAVAALGALPQLSIFRSVEIDDLAQFAIAVGSVTLVADELDRAFSGKAWKSDAVRKIVHEGRHLRVDLFGTFRSTRNVNEDLLGQADHVFLLRHTQAGYWDLQTLRQRFGDGVADAVQGLDVGQFLIWSDA
jgi:hypothetical protein